MFAPRAGLAGLTSESASSDLACNSSANYFPVTNVIGRRFTEFGGIAILTGVIGRRKGLL